MEQVVVWDYPGAEKSHNKHQVRIAGARTKILIWDLPIKTLEYYPHLTAVC
jgi:hypothetical protein